MNRIFESSADRRLLTVVAGSIILMAAVLIVQMMRTAAPGVGIRAQSAPAVADRINAAESEAIGRSFVVERDLLERDLRGMWRAHIPPTSKVSAPPAETEFDILERDLKDLWQSQMAGDIDENVASSGAGGDLLERDLKDLWRAQLAEAPPKAHSPRKVGRGNHYCQRSA